MTKAEMVADLFKAYEELSNKNDNSDNYRKALAKNIVDLVEAESVERFMLDLANKLYFEIYDDRRNGVLNFYPLAKIEFFLTYFDLLVKEGKNGKRNSEAL